MTAVLLYGDALVHLPLLPAHSVDAVVAAPPYGIGFQRHERDQPGPGQLTPRRPGPGRRQPRARRPTVIALADGIRRVARLITRAA